MLTADRSQEEMCMIHRNKLWSYHGGSLAAEYVYVNTWLTAHCLPTDWLLKQNSTTNGWTIPYMSHTQQKCTTLTLEILQ